MLIQRACAADREQNTDLNKKYILRISDNSLYDKRFRQYNLLKEVSNFKINCPKPIEFGQFKDKVYILLTYLDGKPAENEISKFTDIEQYKLGLEAGNILKIIHSYNLHIINRKYF